jgi:hypothetical protein
MAVKTRKPDETQEPQETQEIPDEGKARRKRDPLVEPDLDVLGLVEDVPEDEWESQPLVTTAAIRSEGQQVIDRQVAALKEQWEAAGKPVPNPRKSPRSRRVVKPEHAPALRRMLGLAATFNKVGIAYFDTGHDKDGNEVIVYTVREAPKRGRPANGDSESAENSES